MSTASGRDVVIVSAVRTPIACINGALASVSATRLGAAAIKGAVERAGIAGTEVTEVIMGNVVSSGGGQAPARQAAMFAGLPESVACTTVNKVCASGMKAVTLAAQSIALGLHDVVVAGGMESMSQVPYYLPNARYGMRYGHGKVLDGIVTDGLWDVYNNIHMGSCAEKTAADMKFSREAQDAFAIESYKRSAAAWKAGRFANEIVPVAIPSAKKGAPPTLVTEDEEYKRIDFAKVATLRPAFQPEGGTVTAANASTLNDGASALVLMSADKARALGLKPLARIRGYADAEQVPIEFPTAPAKAVPLAIRRAGLTPADMEYHEVNEAFSVVVLANAQRLGLDLERVNVNGGAVSLGHPIGCSGARILTTLVNVLQQRDATFGTASICNGGGGATAVVLERLK